MSPNEKTKTERIPDDAYYTERGICTKALLWLKEYMGFYEGLGKKDWSDFLFIEPCVGQGHLLPEIREFFPGAQILTNDITQYEELEDGSFRPNDARDADMWSYLLEHKREFKPPYNDPVIVTLTNPPFNCWVDILKQSLQFADMSLFLLPINVQEPCQKGEGKRDDLLEAISHQQVLQGYFNPRPKFRKDKKGTDPRTVGWHCWDAAADTRVNPVNPFRYFTDWRR